MLSREKADDAAILPLKAKGSPPLPPRHWDCKLMSPCLAFLCGFNCDPFASEMDTSPTGLAFQLPSLLPQGLEVSDKHKSVGGRGRRGKGS